MIEYLNVATFCFGQCTQLPCWVRYPKDVIFSAVDPSALQPITLPVMNSLVSTNKVVVDASIDAEMVTEFPSDAQNPLDYIHKAENDTSGPVKQIQVTAQPAVLPKIVR